MNNKKKKRKKEGYLFLSGGWINQATAVTQRKTERRWILGIVGNRKPSECTTRTHK